MKLQVETSLGLGHRVPAGGDGGIDVAAVAAVCEALSTRLAQREPSVVVPPVSLLVTINILVTPSSGQDAAGLKAEGLPSRAPWGGQSSLPPPHRCPGSLSRARQGQPAALPCPTQGPRHTGSLGKTLDSKQATAPAFARHRFPSSFLPTFSLAEREVFQALAYEGRKLRKASWNLRRLLSPGKPSWGAGLPGLCSAARPT